MRPAFLRRRDQPDPERELVKVRRELELVRTSWKTATLNAHEAKGECRRLAAEVIKAARRAGLAEAETLRAELAERDAALESLHREFGRYKAEMQW